MPLKKIDNKGCYILFPGLSIVSSVQEKEFAFWKNIYEALVQCTRLTQFYAPLPPKSYHMTTINLFTEDEITRDKWPHFIEINKNFFHKINTALESPADQFEPAIQITQLITKGVIQFVVQLPATQDKMISELAKQFYLSNGKPQQFHITLAYQYKPISKDEFATLSNEINSKIKEILATQPKSLSLNSAKLCYFNDMTAFIPWDLSFYPFKTNSSSSSSYSIFHHENVQDEEKSNKTLNITPFKSKFYF